MHFRFRTKLSETFVTLRGTERDIIANIHAFLCNVPVSVRF